MRSLTKTLLIVPFLALSGCVLAPDYLKIEGEHTSHLTQHEPFTDHPTNYGYSGMGVLAKWEAKRPGSKLYIELGEEVTLEPLDGRHEVFNARAGIEIPLK